MREDAGFFEAAIRRKVQKRCAVFAGKKTLPIHAKRCAVFAGRIWRMSQNRLYKVPRCYRSYKKNRKKFFKNLRENGASFFRQNVKLAKKDALNSLPKIFQKRCAEFGKNFKKKMRRIRWGKRCAVFGRLIWRIFFEFWSNFFWFYRKRRIFKHAVISRKKMRRIREVFSSTHYISPLKRCAVFGGLFFQKMRKISHCENGASFGGFRKSSKKMREHAGFYVTCLIGRGFCKISGFFASIGIRPLWGNEMRRFRGEK